jgi:hypothetical protein
MAIKLAVGGEKEDLGRSPGLEVLQQAVGGYIEGVRLNPACGFTLMYANEEGLLKQLPLNPLATILAGHPIVGDVVLLSQAEVEEDQD